MNILLEKSGMATLTMMGGKKIEGLGTLVVRERGGMKDANGTFLTEAPEAFSAIRATEALTLEFTDGVTEKVIVTAIDMAGLRFVTTGPVTGI